MPTTSGKGIFYPAATDPLAAANDHQRRLAQSVDNMVQSGTVSVDLSTADANNTANVTFPIAYAAPPQVVVCGNSAPATAAGASSYVWATSVTATGFTAGARRQGALASFTV
jgi:hypothetical protein